MKRLHNGDRCHRRRDNPRMIKSYDPFSGMQTKASNAFLRLQSNCSKLLVVVIQTLSATSRARAVPNGFKAKPSLFMIASSTASSRAAEAASKRPR